MQRDLINSPDDSGIPYPRRSRYLRNRGYFPDGAEVSARSRSVRI